MKPLFAHAYTDPRTLPRALPPNGASPHAAWPGATSEPAWLRRRGGHPADAWHRAANRAGPAPSTARAKARRRAGRQSARPRPGRPRPPPPGSLWRCRRSRGSGAARRSRAPSCHPPRAPTRRPTRHPHRPRARPRKGPRGPPRDAGETAQSCSDPAAGSRRSRGPRIVDARPLNHPRRTPPNGARVEQQPDHHRRIVRRPAVPILAVSRVHRRQVHPRHGVDHKPSKVPLRQPLRRLGGNNNSCSRSPARKP
jgi:hypothetical protein